MPIGFSRKLLTGFFLYLKGVYLYRLCVPGPRPAAPPDRAAQPVPQPTGRILSRFTGDVDGVDNALPSAAEQATDTLIYAIKIFYKCICLYI
jgi:hypothetical protein